MRFARLSDLFSTLRFRLLVWVTVVVVGMEALTMVIIREVVNRSLFFEFNRLLAEEADDIALAVQHDYPHDLPRLTATLQTKSESLSRREWFREWFVALSTSDGRLLWTSYSVPAKLSAPVLGTTASAPADVDGFRVLQRRVTDQDRHTVIVRCGCSRRPVEEDLELVDRIMFWSGLVTLLLAPLGGYALAGRATRPIAKIIATAARLQPSKLHERLPIRGAGDELDQLSQTINGMLDRIALYIERNREFVANAAHELRSPLAAIRSTVEVGLNRARTPEEYTTLLTDVMEESSRLAGLVSRLLLLAEGDAGRLGARDQSVQLDKIVRESLDMFEGVAETREVTLHASELSAVVVPGDEYHLRQVVRNLIDNAIKFTPARGEVHVALGVQAEQHRAWLRVRDSGIGITDDDLPRIFERFYRVNKARTREARPGGHGLGLSICQSIVTALDGTITVESQPGHGSTFTVWLPLMGAGKAVPSNDTAVPPHAAGLE